MKNSNRKVISDTELILRKWAICSKCQFALVVKCLFLWIKISANIYFFLTDGKRPLISSSNIWWLLFFLITYPLSSFRFSKAWKWKKWCCYLDHTLYLINTYFYVRKIFLTYSLEKSQNVLYNFLVRIYSFWLGLWRHKIRLNLKL